MRLTSMFSLSSSCHFGQAHRRLSAQAVINGSTVACPFGGGGVD